MFRPMCLEALDLVPDLLGKPGAHLVGAILGRLIEPPPACDRKVVGPARGEIGARKMHLGKRGAEQLAMAWCRTTRPHAVEKGHDRGRPLAELAQRFPVARLDGGGAG